MGNAARRDQLLEEIRALPPEDREYIEAELMRESCEQGRAEFTDDELEEIKQRARDALSGKGPSYTREETVAYVRASLEERRSRKS